MGGGVKRGKIMKLIPIRMMSEEEWGRFVETPYNPPDDGVSDEAFDDEFYEVENGLRGVLAEFGKEDSYGQVDFYLDNGSNRTRGMGFELGENSTIENLSLIPAIQSYLSTLPEIYDVSICGMNYDFYLYVNKERIQAYTKDIKRLSRFGLTFRVDG
ncbi:MAG: hypothetical protein QM496_17005 [Verrucomicrobiota bacterium]